MHPVEVSGRETEVLAAVGAHLSNAQIAGRLHLSVRTVEGHVSSLLRKYGVADRRELAALVGPDAGPARPPGGRPGSRDRDGTQRSCTKIEQPWMPPRQP
jgi:DNA-binding CsgD family transcriptional regulator